MRQFPRLFEKMIAMSSHQNTKPFISSRQGRPRAFSTLTPHLTEARGITADRISRARSRSTQSHLLSERQQQALLDAVASSGGFHTPQYHLPSSTRSLTESSIDPRSLSLAPTEPISASISNLPLGSIDHPVSVLTHAEPEEEKAFPVTGIEGQNMRYGTCHEHRKW